MQPGIAAAHILEDQRQVSSASINVEGTTITHILESQRQAFSADLKCSKAW